MRNNLHNNEAIAAAVLSSFVEEFGEVDYAKITLVLPFVLQPSIVSFFKNKRTIIRSFEELIAKKGEFLVNFNARYYEFLPLTINSIYMLSQLKFIKFQDGKIVSIKLLEVESKRVVDVNSALPTLCKLFKEDTSTIFLKLRIQL